MTSLSRRTFLEGSAALGAMAVAAGAATNLFVAYADEESSKNESNIVKKHVWCQMCTVGKDYCGQIATVENGVFKHVDGNPLAGNNVFGYGGHTLCAKSNAAPQLVYDPSRILYPMKRVGERGAGEFERCTWDEALQIVADAMNAAKEEYGPESFIILTPQSGDTIDTLGIRFLNLWGSPNYCHNGICWDQRETAKALVLGYCAVQPGQIDKTQLLINWGCNSENSAINQPVGNLRNRLDAHLRGMRVVDIRPMLDPMGSHSDIWMPIRPGTDGALALAFLHIIIGEDLYDHDFVNNWTTGFDKLAEHVKQFTPEWASKVTGLPVEQIYEVGRLMGTTKPMALYDGNGFGDQTNDGLWTASSIFMIFAITGNLDIAGGCGASKVMPPSLIPLNSSGFMHPNLWCQDKQPESEIDKKMGYMPGAGQLVAPEFPRWLYNHDDPKRFRTFSLSSGSQRALEALETEKPYKPRVIMAHATNPMSSLRNPERVAELLMKADFYFVLDQYYNPSCDYADVIFPACTQYEASHTLGVHNMLEGTFAAVSQKLIEPLGESRSDYDFYPSLAEKLGFGDMMWNGKGDGYLEELLEGSGVTLQELREADLGIFKERPLEERVVTEPEYKNYKYLFERLPEGKVPCYQTYIGGKVDVYDEGELPFLPEYIGPAQGIAETPELVEEYPLIFSDVHSHRLAQHSHRSNLPWLREIKPLPWAKINPATAKKYGIEDGDWMKVESPNGWVLLTAEYFEGISPEVLMGRRGWWQPCPELGFDGFRAGNGGSDCNQLYEWAPNKWDKFCSAASKQTLVKISKYEGEVEGITASKHLAMTQAPEFVEKFTNIQEG